VYFVPLHFSKRPPLLLQNSLKEHRVSVEEIPTLVSTQDIIRIKHILDVFHSNPSLVCNILYAQILLFIVEQKVEHTIRPVRDIKPVAQITQWGFRRALSALDE
jgi:hypothetical protein